MSAVNNQKGRGRYSETAYKTVFGQEYHHHMKCSMSEVRECTTIEERICVSKDSRLEEIAKRLCFLGEEGKGEEVGVGEEDGEEYWSDKESVNSYNIDENHPENENDINQVVLSAVQEMFAEHDFVKEDDSSGKTPVGFCRGEDVEIPQTEAETPILNGMGKQCQEAISGFSDNDAAAMLWQLACPTAPTTKEPLSGMQSNITVKMEMGMSARTKQMGISTSYPICKFRKLYTADEAWNNGKAIKASRKSTSRCTLKEYCFIYPILICNCCCWQGSSLIPIGNKGYLEDCAGTRRWWDTDFISGFCSLVAHESHVDGHLRSLKRTQLIHCQFPRLTPDESECKDLSIGTERIVSVLHDVDHYTVLEIDIPRRYMKVYDGLKRCLTRWETHIVNILKRCGLAGRDDTPHFNWKDNNTWQKVRELFFINCGSWLIESDLKIQQRDSHNCGPIACMKVMEMYMCPEFVIMDSSINGVSSYRSVVIDTFSRLVKRFGNELCVSMPVKEINLTDSEQNVLYEDDEPPNDLECFCYSHKKSMSVIAMSCCRKKLHKDCMIRQVENFGWCVYCHAPTTIEILLQMTEDDPLLMGSLKKKW
jgi:hypothetical protein